MAARGWLVIVPTGCTEQQRPHLPVDFDTWFVERLCVVGEVLDSVVAQGLLRILVGRGCGGHRLRALVESFNAQHRGNARAALLALPLRDPWWRIGDASVPGSHADSFATSIALHLRPHTVRLERNEDPESLLVDWEDPNLDFASSSATGVIGDPTAASAELGAALWLESVTSAARFIADFGRDGGRHAAVGWRA